MAQDTDTDTRLATDHLPNAPLRVETIMRILERHASTVPEWKLIAWLYKMTDDRGRRARRVTDAHAWAKRAAQLHAWRKTWSDAQDARRIAEQDASQAQARLPYEEWDKVTDLVRLASDHEAGTARLQRDLDRRLDELTRMGCPLG